MFFLHIAENLDLLAAQFLTPTQKLARAALNNSCPTDVSEDVTFNAQKIEISCGGNFQGRFVCSFEHLNADWPREPGSDFSGDPFHKFDRAAVKRRLYVRKIMAVFEDDGIYSRVDIRLKVQERLGSDLFIVAVIQGR